jgi:hypothetical protein
MNMVDVLCNQCGNFSKRGKGKEGEWWRGVNLRYIISTYVNITMYLPVQLLYANKNNNKETRLTGTLLYVYLFTCWWTFDLLAYLD